ncbi:hypothetical protein [Amycolatopsis sp. FDAARGOS 1241]|uniref:hypothetical protein n=1 Tax=Amycolatopsis sp. FDAARGOS 1241 TaxID=2778070 RepID=UPI00194DED11|nr:hypothetical protein [Amycolatopsis sp. FDAARGOS 1241]QRP44270.1 hypothetical protein I6J71_34060 [Amycolatopsis sp. FDAARGOS 1241]
MRLVRLGQQPSRVAEDVRAALASLGRGSTVIGGVALVGARPAGDDRAVEAVVVLPKGVLIVIGVDLPDPALRLEAPLGGPWKADGWPLVHGDDAVNPATEALDLSQECERRIAELAPGCGPVGTIVAVGPYVETVDQPAADLAGPVRVLHPTPTTMLAATVSLATARSPRSLDQARALISALAPDAPALPDDVLLGEGFVRYTDDPPVAVAAPAPARVEKPAAASAGASAAGPAGTTAKRPTITSVPPPPPVIPTVVPVPHIAFTDTPTESTEPPPKATPVGGSTSAASPAGSDALTDMPTESTAPPPVPGAAPSTSADPQGTDEPDTPLDSAATEKMAAPKQEPVTTPPHRVPGSRPAPAVTAPKATPIPAPTPTTAAGTTAGRPGPSAGPGPAPKSGAPVSPAAASAGVGKVSAAAQNGVPGSAAATPGSPVVGTTAPADRTIAPVSPMPGAPRPGTAAAGALRTGAAPGPVGTTSAARTSATATAEPRQAVPSAPSSAGSRGAVAPGAEKSSRTVRWVPVAAIGLLAVLLVTAIVVAATGGGGGEASPPPSKRASAPAAAPVASSGAPASSAAPSLSFEPRANSADQRCASHAFGDVQASLQQTSCSAVRRASYTALVDGRPAAVTVAVVEFPDAAQATHFKQVADTPGGGGILDVATETGKWPGPPPQFDSAAYASKIDGNGVRLVQVVWQTGPSTPDDPGLTRAAQGALALTMPS